MVAVPPSLTAVLGEVALRVLKIAVAIAVGVGLANVAIEFGAVDRITALAKPLTRPANLPPEVGTAILTTTASPTAGYGMLAEYRESGLLDDRATLVAVTMNTVFGFAQHIFTFYGPVLIPILGLQVGLMYVGARAAIALCITLTGVLAGFVLLSEENVDTTVDADTDAPGVTDGGTADQQSADDTPTSTREKFRAAGESTVEKVWDILPRLAGVYVLVALLVEYNVELAAALTDAAGRPLPDVAALVTPLTGALGLPPAAVPAVGVFAVDTTSGAVFIAPLVENGTFTARAAVATMLVGGIVSFAVSTFKRSIPFQYGIWGAEFGSKVILVNTVLKMGFIAVALAVLLVP
ncbi:nucleoside recognition domain-containing protein [Halorientalis litorea]|uniref:nucleoside recognition domain-containing protein n=1 Tax=Halorientalis litorea TaxID=2931977 RepID=UPI001FF21038|nr:nucleoside recognition domain-containing protein [Halorientalis litorea]